MINVAASCPSPPSVYWLQIGVLKDKMSHEAVQVSSPHEAVSTATTAYYKQLDATESSIMPPPLRPVGPSSDGGRKAAWFSNGRQDKHTLVFLCTALYRWMSNVITINYRSLCTWWLYSFCSIFIQSPENRNEEAELGLRMKRFVFVCLLATRGKDMLGM